MCVWERRANDPLLFYVLKHIAVGGQCVQTEISKPKSISMTSLTASHMWGLGLTGCF